MPRPPPLGGLSPASPDHAPLLARFGTGISPAEVAHRAWLRDLPTELHAPLAPAAARSLKRHNGPAVLAAGGAGTVNGHVSGAESTGHCRALPGAAAAAAQMSGGGAGGRRREPLTSVVGAARGPDAQAGPRAARRGACHGAERARLYPACAAAAQQRRARALCAVPPQHPSRTHATARLEETLHGKQLQVRGRGASWCARARANRHARASRQPLLCHARAW